MKIHNFWQLLARQGPCFCANGLLVKERPWSFQMQNCFILFILVVQIVYPTRPSTCLLIQRRLQKPLQHGHAIAQWKSSSHSTFPAQPFPTWRNRINFVAGKSSLNELTVKSNALWMDQLLQSNELQLINSDAVKWTSTSDKVLHFTLNTQPPKSLRSQRPKRLLLLMLLDFPPVGRVCIKSEIWKNPKNPDFLKNPDFITSWIFSNLYFALPTYTYVNLRKP